jgi:hypothetical protein
MVGRFPFRGKRDRLRWSGINAMAHKYSLPAGKIDRVIRDGSSPPEGKFAEHVLPPAGKSSPTGRQRGEGEKRAPINPITGLS